ncbi:MAG: HEAT repeat domain-containing protein [Anaerolineales bacterium]|nr:HEAT repeat domain-containing protein [Anaerolineales bacterium]
MAESNTTPDLIQQLIGALISVSIAAFFTWFLLRKLINTPALNQQNLNSYLEKVIEQHRYLDPQGTIYTARQTQVSLGEIYISLQAEQEAVLSTVDRRLFEEESRTIIEMGNLVPEEQQELVDNVFSKVAKYSNKRIETVELLDLVRNNSRLVILGDPGAGKTTLLRYLTLRHALAMIEGEKNTSELGKIRLPLYMRISDYAEHSQDYSLSDFLIRDCCQNQDSRSLEKLIRRKLLEGECLILLDGLDEVVEASQRAEIVHEVNIFVRQCVENSNCIVITSRVTGYRTAPLSGEIPHFHVRDMTDNQIRQFLFRWCNAIEYSAAPETPTPILNLKAQKELDGILLALRTNQSVRLLATNPLLLRTLAQIHRTGSRLPQQRVELYELAAKILIKDWRLSQGIPQEVLIDEDEAIILLAELAGWLHQNKPSGIATEGEVRKYLSEVKGRLKEKNPEHPEVQTSVSNFLRRIREHTGLFIERAPKRYGFMHLAFEEYFAARWLISTHKDTASRIRNKLHHPRWEEPILLALGYYGVQYPDELAALIKKALLGEDLGGPSPYEEILHRDLLIAVRFLGDMDVKSELRKELVQKFFQLWLDCNNLDKTNYLREYIIRVAHTLQGGPVQKELLDNLIQAIVDKNQQLSISSIEILHNATLTPQATLHLLQATKDKYPFGTIALALLKTSSFSLDATHTLLKELNKREMKETVIPLLRNNTEIPEVVNSLLLMCKDGEAKNRTLALYALSSVINDEEVTKSFLAALKDEEKSVRISAMNILSEHIESPEIVANLFNIYKDENIIKDSDVFNAILAELNDEDKGGGERIKAMEILSNKAELQIMFVSGLLAALSDNNVNVRNGALKALQNVTPTTETVSTLINFLINEDEAVNKNIIDLLNKSTTNPENIDILIHNLKNESADIRANITKVLSKLSINTKVKAALLNAVGDENSKVRASAIKALYSAVGDTNILTTIVDALKDKDAEVRISAAQTLSGAINHQKVLDTLIAALKDEDVIVAASAIFSLRNAPNRPEVISNLLLALKDPSIRIDALEALSNFIESPEVVSAIIPCLLETDVELRAKAAIGLMKAAKNPDVVLALLNAAKDMNAKVRVNAIKSLIGATNNIEVAAELVNALKDQNVEVRAEAARALQYTHLSDNMIYDLLLALKDESDFVRISIMKVFENNANSPNILTILLNATRDKNPNIRACAIQALESSSNNFEVAKALIISLRDSNPEVRALAAHSLHNAAAFLEAINALFDALNDKDHRVITIAARTLAKISRRPNVILPQDFPSRLAMYLSSPEFMFQTIHGAKPASEYIFEALLAVAPPPKVVHF